MASGAGLLQPGACSARTCIRRSRVQQIEIGALDELRIMDAEPLHERVRFRDAALDGFTVAEHHFELEEMTEVFYAIEVDACATRDVEDALLAYAPDLPVRKRECFAQRVG